MLWPPVLAAVLFKASSLGSGLPPRLFLYYVVFLGLAGKYKAQVESREVEGYNSLFDAWVLCFTQ